MAVVMRYNSSDYGHRHSRPGEAQDAEGAAGRVAIGDPAVSVYARADVGGRSDGRVRRGSRSGADDGADGDGATAGERLSDADESGRGVPLRAVCCQSETAARPGARVRGEGARGLGLAVLRLSGRGEGTLGRGGRRAASAPGGGGRLPEGA